jgi:N-formylglutamate amidohydrolase
MNTGPQDDGQEDQSLSAIHLDHVVRRHEPAAPAALVFDSPHSGTIQPPDFAAVAPAAALRRPTDAFVDEIFAAASDLGGVLLAAQFPRSYIDPNRDTVDVDPAMIDAPWPHPTTESFKTGRGTGLVWRVIPPDTPIYDRKLTVAEVEHRIETYWRTYHRAVKADLDRVFETFGAVWHVNCHSMPAMGDATTEDGPVARAEFVLGDRDGTTCDPAFTDTVAGFLGGLGYGVKINDPYKGVELVRRYSDPAAGRHSLQIEINRGLYMDEATGEKAAGFGKLRDDVTALIGHIRAFAQENTPERGVGNRRKS